MARLEVLERFLQEIGTEAGSLSLESIMEVSPHTSCSSSTYTIGGGGGGLGDQCMSGACQQDGEGHGCEDHTGPVQAGTLSW